MEHGIIWKEEFKVVGIELQTTNKDNKAAQDIPVFWEKFFREKLQNKIPNKIDHEILGIYTDYEGDFMAPFSFIIGCRVRHMDKVPEGMIAKDIPKAKYVKFVAKGKQPEALLKTWQEIWASNLERNYTTDFEVYGSRFSNTDESEIDVFISVK